MEVSTVFRKKNRCLWAIGIVMCCSLFFSACLKDDDNSYAYPGEFPAALVSFIHASPNSGDLIVGINGYRVNNQAFKYGDRIIYQYLLPGGNQFQVNTAIDDKPKDVKSWGLEGGVCYSIFAIDRLDSLQLLGVRDFYSDDTPPSGTARVRFINLCPDSLQLDLRAIQVDTLLAKEKKFREYSAFGNIPADENSPYAIEILNHLTGNVLDTLTFSPKAGQYYTIMALGLTNTEKEDQQFHGSIFRHD